jgi:hypothetical protein
MLLATCLKEEADRHWMIDATVSLRLAKAIVLLGCLMAKPEIMALGRMARADALRVRGEPQLALRLLDSPAALFTRCNDMVGWARTQISKMSALIDLGQPRALREALKVAARARAVLIPQREHFWVARLEANAAVVDLVLDRPARALERYAAILAICRDLATPPANALLVRTRSNPIKRWYWRAWGDWPRHGRHFRRLVTRRWAWATRWPSPAASGILAGSWCFRAAMDRRCGPSRMHAVHCARWGCRGTWRGWSAICWSAIWRSIAPIVCWR